MVMIICPDCGKEQDNLNKFCRNCGADLSKVEVVEENEDLSKVEVVEENSDLSNVEVVEDNVDLSKEDVIEDNNDSSKDPIDNSADDSVSNEDKTDSNELIVPESVVLEEKTQEENVLKCSDCGTELSPNVKFCPNCGKSTNDLNAEGSLKFCPSCGTDLGSNVKFCPNCGFNLNQVNIKPNTTANAPVENRNPFVSIILSIVFPGLGQLYNGQNTKGLYFIIMAIVSWLLCLILIGALLYVLVWLWSIFDAYQSAEAINKGEIPEDKLF